MTRRPLSRRRFVGAAAASSAWAIVPRHVLGGAGYVAPNDKITLAHIGMGTQGFRELGGLLADPAIQIVAVCDPNTDSNDYVEWSKNGIRNTIRRYLDDPSWREGVAGCPGGREVGRLVVDAYYARQRAAEKFKACAAYADFRELLEKQQDLDAVKIMTPDHLHAVIAIAALRKGKHVMVHKPLANRLIEGRRVVEAARKAGVATMLLAYGSGVGNGAIARWLDQGELGAIREIHNWTNRPVWPQYDRIPEDRPPVPKGFAWDLWLGPERPRPYHPHYTHTVFRGWYDFGGGSIADMGVYSLWPVFTALELPPPVSAEAWATHTCAIADHVSRPVINDVAFPIGCAVRFRFQRGGGRPDLELFWYDGGMKPRLPADVEAHDVRLQREGILYVCDRGAVLAGFHGQEPQLFARGRRTPLWSEGRTPPTDPDQRPASHERHTLWLEAVRQGTDSPGSFLTAGPITDAVNLAAVALRARGKVLFDSRTVRITNNEQANQYLTRQYREGWEPLYRV